MPGFKVIVVTEKMQQTISTGLGSVDAGFRFIRQFASELCWNVVDEDRQFRFAIAVWGTKAITFKVERE